MEMVVFYLQVGFIGVALGLLVSLIVDKIMEIRKRKRQDRELLEKVQKIIDEYEAKVNELMDIRKSILDLEAIRNDLSN